jgi:hypothetical protein
VWPASRLLGPGLPTSRGPIVDRRAGWNPAAMEIRDATPEDAKQIPNRQCPHRYLAICEFESESAALAVQAFMERAGTPRCARSRVCDGMQRF